MYRLFSSIAWLILGFVIPGYQTFKVLKSGFGLAHISEFQILLKFWLVIASCTFILFFTDALLFWVPFYYEFKIVFVFYLTLPQTKGFLSVYEKYIFPALSEREKEIDGRLEIYSESIKKQTYIFFEYGRSCFLKVCDLLLIKVKEVISQNRNNSVFGHSSLGLLQSQYMKFVDPNPHNLKDETSSKLNKSDGSWLPDIYSFQNSLQYLSSKSNSNASFQSQQNEPTNANVKATNLDKIFGSSEETMELESNTESETPKEIFIEQSNFETLQFNKNDESSLSDEKPRMRPYHRNAPFLASSDSNMRNRFGQSM